MCVGSSPPSPAKHRKLPLPLWALILIGIGGLLLIAAIVIVILFIIWRTRNNNRSSSYNNEDTEYNYTLLAESTFQLGESVPNFLR